MTPAIEAAKHAERLAQQAVATHAEKRNALLAKREANRRLIEGIKATDSMAALEALAQDLPPPERPRDADRKLRAAQRELEAIPAALGDVEAKLAQAHRATEDGKQDFRTAGSFFVADELDRTASEFQQFLAGGLELLARMAALELIKERLVGPEPVRNLDPSRTLWSGRWAAITACTGIPERLRGQGLTPQKILERAIEIADEITAQIME